MSFAAAFTDVVMRCQGDLDVIKDARTRMKARLDEAAALHGIDPGGVRRLLVWLRLQMTEENNINQDRQAEIDKVYRRLVNCGAPVVSERADTELNKVMSLVKSDKPPKIDSIMESIGCSRGKAHKLRTLAAARLAAKSSSSREIGERELSTIAAADDAGDEKTTEVLAADGPESDEVLMTSDSLVAAQGNRAKMIDAAGWSGRR